MRTAPSGIVVVDCLMLWLTDWLCQPEHDDFSKDFSSARAALLATLLAALQAHHADEIILVSNETGLGIIPLGALTRRFVDEAGWLNQDVARLAE